MKKKSLGMNFLLIITSGLAHGGEQGQHHQESNVLGSADPLALGVTLAVSLIGIILLGLSVRKYRKDSS